MQDLIITSRGERLAARLAGGIASAEFTKVRASAADLSALTKDELRALETLPDIRQEAAASEVRCAENSTLDITAAMDNLELASGYYTRAIGLYAEDGDNNEILFAVSVEPNDPFYMPPFAGKTVSGVTYKLSVAFGGSENVVLGARSDVYASAVRLEEEVRRINERIDGLTFTEEINAHNANQNAHPKLLNRISALDKRLALVELAAGENVGSNPFIVRFGDLEGVIVDGVWNLPSKRIEF